MKVLRTLLLSALAAALLPLAAPSAARADVDVYTEPGTHQVGGRQWRTTCEPYSRTERCRTEIWATTVVQSNGRFVQRAGWAFNNLTYRDSPRTLWRENPLGRTGSWTASDGRRWRTECDTPATGRNGCRSYAQARVVASFLDGRGNRAYRWQTSWVFNNIVRFGPITPRPTPTPTPSPTTPAQRMLPVTPGTVVAGGLSNPWSLVFVDGRPVFSERGGALSTVVNGSVVRIATIRGVDPEAEGGLLGLAVSPAHPATLFAYYTSASDNRVVRMPLTRSGNSFTVGSQTVVIDNIPKARAHNGGRIAFGPDGMLYIGTGDAGNRPAAQRLGSLAGKILRVHPDGRIPADNPYGTAVWSYGHRNVQGLAWDAGGRMWATEFGDNTWDELNTIVRGGNYGWPEAEGASADPEFRDPVVVWRPAQASPSGLLAKDGNLYVASLRGERLWAMLDRNPSSTLTSTLEGDVGRIRDVVAAPDGTLWVLTSKGTNDQIVSYRLRQG